MLACDRCGKEIPQCERKDAERRMIIYGSQEDYTIYNLDLCEDCLKLYDDYRSKMESYFMVNEDPIKILDDKKYWL